LVLGRVAFNCDGHTLSIMVLEKAGEKNLVTNTY
jgi:hypothetical protein